MDQDSFWPCHIAIDSKDNVYVTSKHKLQKFDRNGEFVKSVGSGSEGSKLGEFNLPRGVKVHQNQVYVCDFHSNGIQVFDLELSFIKCFGTQGSRQGQYDRPSDLAFDSQGNIYVGEYGNKRVQVLDPNDHYHRQFSDKSVGQGNLTDLREYTLPKTMYMYWTMKTIVFMYSSCLVNFSPPLARKGGKEVNSVIHVALRWLSLYDCVTG